MSKINENMLSAIAEFSASPPASLRGKQFDNTRVDAKDSSLRVFLHGNLIASSDDSGASWEVNLCGWNTSTTRSRLTALIRSKGFPGVSTKGGTPRLHDARGITEIDTGQFHKVHF